MGGRDRVDPELARLVEQRLEDLLAGSGPRRSERDAEPRVPDEPTEPRPEAEPARRRASSSSRAATEETGELEELDSAPALSKVDSAGGRPRWRGFTRAHLAVVAVLASLGVLLAGWAVLRARPVPLPAQAAPRATPEVSAGTTTRPPTASATGPALEPAAASAGDPSSPRASPAGVVVHVLGAVRRPGLVRLPERARVQDAIDKAGGLRPGADLGELNLAQLLTDGQQVLIGRTAARSAGRSDDAPATGSEVRGSGPIGTSSGGTGGGSAPQVDLNRATVAELETLPGVGPVTAAKIIAWREQHGRYSRVEELQEVAGIGPKTYADIAPLCRV